jgi:hypothetical protein
MARPRVADGLDDLQIWRVPGNILRSRGQLTKGGTPAWGLGVGVAIPHRKKKKSLLQNVRQGLGLAQNTNQWWDLVNRTFRFHKREGTFLTT